MNGNNSMCSESISHLVSSVSDEESSSSPQNSGANTTVNVRENINDAFDFCGGYENYGEMPDRRATTTAEAADTTATRTGTSSTAATTDPLPSYAEMNPKFDIGQYPVEKQFDWIEKEFAAIETRTMNPRQYNFTTSYAFPTKNRYINVMANEETLFPLLNSPRAVRSSAQGTPAATRSTGQRILDTLRGSPTTTTADSTSMCDDVSRFKSNSVTASGKNVPLYFNGNILNTGVDPIFVASQAPVLDCMEDFLNTVYNYQIPLILVLTDVEEGGFVKADRYWPADKASGLAGEVFGNMAVYKDLSDPYRVDAKHELFFRPFFIRPCNVPKEKAHKVTTVQYVGWPDRGVPDSTESFEELLRIISDQTAKQRPSSTPEGNGSGCSHANGSNRNSNNSHAGSSASGNSTTTAKKTPSVLVHCSAGIGRTGTLIGAYTAIKLMEAGRLDRDSLSGILTDMRKARFGMVQRVEQYMFLYLIVLQHLGVDTKQFAARMQPRADLYNYRWIEARQAAMATSRARQQQQQQ